MIPYNKVNTLTKTQLKTWVDADALCNNGPLWDIPVNDLIGIEVEVENVGNGCKCLCWHAVNDGSLRNHGVEFRTLAFTAAYTPEVVSELMRQLKATNAKYDFSERTSIHVHIDFRNNYLEDFVKTLIAYIPFEKLIFKELIPLRFKNTFCMPIADILAGCDGFTRAVQKMREFTTLEIYNIEDITQSFTGKYAAINPLNLFQGKADRFEHQGTGTLEFRHLHGTDDIELIVTWVKLIGLLKHYASKVSYPTLEKEIFTLNSSSEYQNFATKVFGKYGQRVLPPHKIIELLPLLSEGVSAAKELLVPKSFAVDPVQFLGSPIAKVLQQKIGLGIGKEVVKKPKIDVGHRFARVQIPVQPRRPDAVIGAWAPPPPEEIQVDQQRNILEREIQKMQLQQAMNVIRGVR
jgi:hypothetical protein